MKSEADIRNDVYSYIKTSALASAVNGQVYKDSRPTDSTKEDIHIKVQAVTFTQIQTAVVLVRIFLPDTVRDKDSVLSTKRQEELEAIAVDVLESYNAGDWRIDFEEQYTQEVPNNSEHVIINHLYYRYCNNQ